MNFSLLDFGLRRIALVLDVYLATEAARFYRKRIEASTSCNTH
jgi:hypothetical protein